MWVTVRRWPWWRDPAHGGDLCLRQNGIHPHMAEVAERALADRSQVLRLIVAAPARTWRPAWSRNAPAAARAGAPTRTAAQETILHALGHRPERLGSGRPRGATGLWWVARVVRSYHGAVQARTADLLAGRLFGRKPTGPTSRWPGWATSPERCSNLPFPPVQVPPSADTVGNSPGPGCRPDPAWWPAPSTPARPG